MSIITSEVNYKTEVLAAGQNTKGYFSPKKSIILRRGRDDISLTTSLLSLPINTTIMPTASTWTITFLHCNLRAGDGAGTFPPRAGNTGRTRRARAPAWGLGGMRCTDLSVGIPRCWIKPKPLLPPAQRSPQGCGAPVCPRGDTAPAPSPQAPGTTGRFATSAKIQLILKLCHHQCLS